MDGSGARVTSFTVLYIQWVKIIIVLERTYSRQRLLQYQQRYSVPLDAGRNTSQRAIMVISETRKSRAFRRQHSAARWKVRNAGLPRRRHGHRHRHRLAKHGYNLTSDTRYFLAVSVSVSASWNASLIKHPRPCHSARTAWYVIWPLFAASRRTKFTYVKFADVVCCTFERRIVCAKWRKIGVYG